jgi:hypothetical protein
MKIVDPGLSYELAGGNRLVSLQKGDGKIIRDGTTNQELLTVLIDRVTGAFQNLPCHGAGLDPLKHWWRLPATRRPIPHSPPACGPTSCRTSTRNGSRSS